jgi:sporulation integral membrane protein YlbJ
LKRIHLKDIILPAIVAALNIIIILFPKETLSAAKDGVELWFFNVFPSLLPFLIGTNLLQALGAVSFFGTLAEPLSQRIFGISGEGVFAAVAGFLSGYPTGAKITADLRQKNIISKDEANRLVTFANNSGPLFILGAVAAGMFGNVPAGYFILVIHYISAIVMGLIFRNYKRSKNYTKPTGNPLRQAFLRMREKREKGPFGMILAKSVSGAVETMLQAGGFIILFCVVLRAAQTVGLIRGTEFFQGINSGIVEMTNGSRQIASSGSNIKHAVIAAAAVISWGGLSVHAQSVAFLSKTDINVMVYIAAKAFQAGISVVLGFALYPLFSKSIDSAYSATVMAEYSPNFANGITFGVVSFGAALAIIFLLAIIASVIRSRKR